ncbi:growth-regulating factor 5-like isoform X1 [Primulina eburnea]|uniref:growth-regulating factor 5-like isoform X1 n=2 Tax=Primulina eburnea TaxID=1245227 RepID=UPI003C6BD73C
MMNTARSSTFPFTAVQWQELEHQALVFKYMVSGLPIPPDLLFAIRRSLDPSVNASKFLLHQPQHFGWNGFEMGFGRKMDPEPGRCRRTDGKKWRCSKEAYPDSKYCERHMHRGRNRSRKPVEVNPINATSISKNTHSFSSSDLESHFLYPHLGSTRSPGVRFPSSQDNTANFFMESSASSHPPPKDCRNSYGQGIILTMGSSVSQMKHTEYSCDVSLNIDQPKKMMHRFLDEHPHKKDTDHSWPNNPEEKRATQESTQLSISPAPNSLHNFFMTHKWYKLTIFHA